MNGRAPTPYDGNTDRTVPSHLLRNMLTVRVELAVRSGDGYCDPVVLAAADQSVPDELDVDRVAGAVSAAISRAVRLPWYLRALRVFHRRRRR